MMMAERQGAVEALPRLAKRVVICVVAASQNMTELEPELPSVVWSKVSVKVKTKAVADFCFLGHCVFPSLINPRKVAELLQKARSRQVKYTSIFNELGSKQSPALF